MKAEERTELVERPWLSGAMEEQAVGPGWLEEKVPDLLGPGLLLRVGTLLAENVKGNKAYAGGDVNILDAAPLCVSPDLGGPCADGHTADIVFVPWLAEDSGPVHKPKEEEERDDGNAEAVLEEGHSALRAVHAV